MSVYSVCERERESEEFMECGRDRVSDVDACLATRVLLSIFDHV